MSQEKMRVKVRIKPDGTVTHDVTERGAHLCSTVYTITNGIGKTLSDEETGPECDEVHEVQGG